MSISRRYSQSFVRYEVAYATIEGSDPICALFLSYIAFRCHAGQCKESHANCERYTALSRKQQDRAATFWMSLGVLSKEVKGADTTIWYSVDFDRLDLFLCPERMSQTDNREGVRMSERDNHECPKGTIHYKEEVLKEENTVRQAVTQASEQAQALYSEYPRKAARPDAIRAITKALRTTSYEVLLTAVQDYKSCVARWPEEAKMFIPMPSTWFNQQRWTDDRKEWLRHALPEKKVAPLTQHQRILTLEEEAEIQRQAESEVGGDFMSDPAARIRLIQIVKRLKAEKLSQ